MSRTLRQTGRGFSQVGGFQELGRWRTLRAGVTNELDTSERWRLAVVGGGTAVAVTFSGVVLSRTKFVFLYDIERILYGDTGHSTGAVHRLLQRESLSQTVVSLKRSSVSDHAPTALCTAVTDGRLGVRVVLHAGHYSRPPACARRTECLCHGHGRLGRCADA